jgi:hypothetical protein
MYSEIGSSMTPSGEQVEIIREVGGELASLIRAARTLPGMAELSGEWERQRADLEAQMTSERVCVAVVGPIKSGKSTFINALLGGDYLKRGAGVVTSIVTRIRRGEALSARLTLKSWEEINESVEGATALFPPGGWQPAGGAVDLRRETDRRAISEALAGLGADRHIGENARNPHSALLTSVLNGYSRMRDRIGESAGELSFSEARFREHQEYTGDDDLAVYLSDVRLTINAPMLPAHVEIADCQGSDSPNPLHLAMIQQYLLRTHLIVYVISSRTGLRGADIRFLSIIRKMGMIDSALFVVNFDFGEHETVADLDRVVDKVREELSLIVSDPRIYVISALRHLFRELADGGALTDKDRRRLALWEAEPGLRERSDLDHQRFSEDFRRIIIREADQLICATPRNRMAITVEGLSHRLAIQRELLTRDADGAAGVAQRIEAHQQRMAGIRKMIRTTVDGAAGRIKGELRVEVDRFLDSRGELGRRIFSAIRDYPAASSTQGDIVDPVRFSRRLYGIYQEISQAVDRYTAETVVPEVLRFVRDAEQRIADHFESVTAPYDVMLREAFDEYNQTVAAHGIPPVAGQASPIGVPDLAALRSSGRITLPTLRPAIRYSARAKTEAVIQFGWYSALRLVKRMLRRPFRADAGGTGAALRKGVDRIKGEMIDAMAFGLKDYRENLKYQYILKLVDLAGDHICQAVSDRFGAHVADMGAIAELLQKSQTDRTAVRDRLDTLMDGAEGLGRRLNAMAEETADGAGRPTGTADGSTTAPPGN